MLRGPPPGGGRAGDRPGPPAAPRGRGRDAAGGGFAKARNPKRQKPDSLCTQRVLQPYPLKGASEELRQKDKRVKAESSSRE